MFEKGIINGVIIKQLTKFIDERGFLVEIFRKDEMDEESHPVMTYISVTQPGVARGPHEHVHQADLFAFIGPANFKLVLWDNRKESETYRKKMVIFGGEDKPVSVFIPAGVVHAYQNVSSTPGTVINCPDRLFMGDGKKEPVDEIRYEADENSAFII